MVIQQSWMAIQQSWMDHHYYFKQAKEYSLQSNNQAIKLSIQQRIDNP